MIVEVLEGALGDQRGDLRADRAAVVGLVDDHDLRAFARCGEDRLLVERLERAQVEQADAALLDLLDRSERGMNHRPVGDHDEVVAVADGARLERRLVRAFGHLAPDAAVEALVLHEDDRVRIGDRS